MATKTVEQAPGARTAAEAFTVVAGQTTALEFTAPTEPGEYAYQCDFHPAEMKGMITVG